MSVVERHRLEIFSRVKEGRISIGKAGELCGLSHRQARRVWKRYREQGDAGLVHRGRGQRGNHRSKAALRKKVLAAYRARYAGFGAVLASECLAQEKLVVSSKTLWRWLGQEGLRQPQRRHRTHRSRRERRACRGELVQMDGSTHDWFEGRGGVGMCVLYVMVDDATGRVFARFYASEDTRSAFDLFGQYSRAEGLPVALYVDKDSIYTVNNRAWTASETLSGTGPLSQFGRAMKQLNVEIILAHSPQAKGRVERMNGTLQDRLVKCMRVKKIASIEAANGYLKETFLPAFNAQFGKAAREQANVHRPWPGGVRREEVLCVIEERTVGQDWCVVHEKRVYQLDQRHQGLALAGRSIQVLTLADQTVRLLHKGSRLTWKQVAGQLPAQRTKRVPDLRPNIAGLTGEPLQAAIAMPAAPSAAPPPPRALRRDQRTVLMRR